MIDYFALGLTHALIVIACLRLLLRDDLDRDPAPAAKAPPADPAARTPGKYTVRLRETQGA